MPEVQTIKKAKLKDTNIPRRLVDKHKANKGIKTCCKNENNLNVEGFKTSEDRPHTDKIVMTCSKCGCRHFRMGMDAAGAIGKGKRI